MEYNEEMTVLLNISLLIKCFGTIMLDERKNGGGNGIYSYMYLLIESRNDDLSVIKFVVMLFRIFKWDMLILIA